MIVIYLAITFISLAVVLIAGIVLWAREQESYGRDGE